MSSPPDSETRRPTEDASEGDSSLSSLHETNASAEEQDDGQDRRMSLLTSSFKFRPSVPSQNQDMAEDKAQDNESTYPADAIVESTEIPCDPPIPILAPLPPPDQEVDIPTETSASKEDNQKQRYYTRADIPLHREPPSSLPQYIYIPPRLTHPSVRTPSPMARRTRSPSPDIASERPKTPAPDQTAALFGKLESHGQSTYTTEPPQLEELDPRDPDDAQILEFADERPMDPSRRTDVDRLPRQGHTGSTVQAVPKGA
jgi:hypothetical protein